MNPTFSKLPMKGILYRASEFNRGIERALGVEIKNLAGLRTLLLQAEHPLMISAAAEFNAPAEVNIMICDDEVF